MCTELGLQSKVQFLDWVNHDDIPKYYMEAKVVVAPSRWPEPFTLIGQEAMRHGRPVVAFDVGGNSNWLDHEQTGLLVPEQDIPAYAAALERVLTNTAYANQLGGNAYKRVRERFSFRRYLDQVEEYLSQNR
jgi:glycosyltransferase involved in cell wall biosynthesis